jgi:hypothetical protein
MKPWTWFKGLIFRLEEKLSVCSSERERERERDGF